MAQPHYVSETQVLRRVVSNPNCRFDWRKHALERMLERRITSADVIEALTNGQVTLAEQKRDEVWRVEGRDIDGNRIVVEVAVYEEAVVIKVITTF